MTTQLIHPAFQRAIAVAPIEWWEGGIKYGLTWFRGSFAGYHWDKRRGYVPTQWAAPMQKPYLVPDHWGAFILDARPSSLATTGWLDPVRGPMPDAEAAGLMLFFWNKGLLSPEQWPAQRERLIPMRTVSLPLLISLAESVCCWAETPRTCQVCNDHEACLVKPANKRRGFAEVHLCAECMDSPAVLMVAKRLGQLERKDKAEKK